MFSWLVIVTFIVSILFYAMFPRTDAFKSIDKPWSNYYGDILVHQHLAAWKASTVKNFDEHQEEYNYQVRNGSSGVSKVDGKYYITEEFPYIKDFLYPGEVGKGGVYTLGENAKIKSVILCVDNAKGEFLNKCSVNYGGEKDDSGNLIVKKGTSDYLVTFTTLPETEAYLAIRQLGEKMFLMNMKPVYETMADDKTAVGQPDTSDATKTADASTSSGTTKAKDLSDTRNYIQRRASLHVQCGLLKSGKASGGGFDPESSYVLNNTRHENFGIPPVVAKFVGEKHGSEDVLMCITRLFAAYNTSEMPAVLIYPKGDGK